MECLSCFFFFSSRRRHTRCSRDWSSDVCSSDLLLARRYGRPAFRGKLGQRLLSERTIGHIEREYERHGGYGIFVSRLLPVWRGVVMPFAGLAGVSAPRALVPLALAAALWYGLLTYAVVSLGANLDAVLALLRRANHVLGVAALAATVALALWIWRHLKR